MTLRSRHRLPAWCALALIFALGWAGPAKATEVDLELVLAVDASGSVDPEEYALQLGGIATAFRDRAIQDAIASGPLKRIAVNLLVWAEPRQPKDETGWFVLSTPAEAEVFANLVQALPRTQNGATGLGEGIAAAIRTITGNGLKSRRRVIDVSGDGIEAVPGGLVLEVSEARAMAIANGVTINGLAIETEVYDLLGFYRDNMRTGPGSFVISVRTYEDFATGIRRKLLREIEYRPEISLNR
ncbi:MAG: DUF1194 domain-containing protein [Alphaproteobacteria bacterium]|nr:DUF1194 domain-containing protein [Alphaproteobacteria bacterium]